MWTTLRRETGLIEHVCEHGVGHPNHGSVQYMEFMSRYQDKPDFELDIAHYMPTGPYEDSTWAVHGCDGCCSGEDFPGSAAGSIKHAFGVYLAELPDLLQFLKERHFLLWWGIMAALHEARGIEE